MGLWVPPAAEGIAADLEREAMIDRAFTDACGAARYLDGRLKELDPYLSLEFFGDAADAPGIIPGRWHIRRRNPTTVDAYFPITDENGNYRDPVAADVDRLRGEDLQNPRVMERMRKRDADRIKRAERRRELETAERREELADHIKAIGSPGVSFTQAGTPWTYRAGARKG